MNFGVTYRDHFPQYFQVGYNSFQRGVVVTREKNLSDSLENEERFFGRELFLVKEAKDLVHALTVEKDWIVKGESAQRLLYGLAQYYRLLISLF